MIKANALLSLAGFAFMLVVPPIGMAQEGEKPSPDRTILVQTVRLTEPLGGFRKLTLLGVPGGEGTLVLDPNRCTTDLFGDDDECTEIALKTRRVSLPVLKIADPHGRALHLVAGAGLDGSLYLVTPGTSADRTYRFVYDSDAGRKVVTAESIHPTRASFVGGGGGLPIFALAGREGRCAPIGFEEARVVPGFVNDTYILVVTGEVSSASVRPRLVPRVYVRQPEYWEIDLVGCSQGDVQIPVTKPYIVSLPLDGVRGTKGIKLIGKDKEKTLEVPPTTGR